MKLSFANTQTSTYRKSMLFASFDIDRFRLGTLLFSVHE